ncbi:hypothetical protein QP179_01515 [Sphingomonas aurantiaca]|uniref:hypothetical protein n=1 Tax=Sphingomonas aurantiaca TaxID=185949 RepID=UPI002FDFE4E2
MPSTDHHYEIEARDRYQHRPYRANSWAMMPHVYIWDGKYDASLTIEGAKGLIADLQRAVAQAEAMK